MSREVDLYKDKIEVSLDGRQIFYLFFGGAVIVGLVFVLGVMVGRRVEARGHVDRSNVAATVDPLAALDRLEGSNGLSFQGSLRGGDAPTSDVDKTIASMQKPDDGKKDKKHADKAEVKVEEKKVEEKKTEAKVEDKKTEAKVEDKKADEKKTDEKKTEAKAEDKKIEAKADAKKIEAKPDDKKTEAKTDAKKTEEKKSETKTDDRKLASADEKKSEEKKDDGEKKSKFTLQLSSFQDKGEAQAYLDSIKSAGYQAYVTEGAVDGKQYYRVRMGSYRSMDAANDAKAEFEKTAKKTAIVTKL